MVDTIEDIGTETAQKDKKKQNFYFKKIGLPESKV